jgi:hypothetical protein
VTLNPTEHIFRTAAEIEAGSGNSKIFDESNDSIEIRLENFPKYVRRQHLKRFLAMYEIYKMVLPVKGSIVECGVFRGFGLMSWAKLSAILEPENLTRRIYGFDTFSGFPSTTAKDKNGERIPEIGGLGADSFEEINALIDIYDSDRFLGHIPKVSLIRGDISETMPKFLKENQHLVVSLLFIDCDLHGPTLAALKEIVPRMPKGALLVFDELDNPIWPGETLAVLEEIGLNNLELRRLEWDPYISFARIGY